MKRTLLILWLASLALTTEACTSWGHFWEIPEPVNTPPQLRIAFSGQTQCASGAAGTSTMLACPQTVTGQNGEYPNIPAARSFTGPTPSNGGYITTDNVTGLVWKTCSEGLTDSGGTCTGSTSTFTFSPTDTATPQCAALNAGTGYAGLANWRLPTVAELQTLVNYGITSPAPTIDAAYFPATFSSGYWSSSNYLLTANSAWYVNFSDGSVSFNPTASANRVRCVASAPTAHVTYTDNSNGTVSDTLNNLVWQKCSDGLSGTNCSGGSIIQQTWQNALSYCNGLSATLPGHTWRLPSTNELFSLIDATLLNPAVNASKFPATFSSGYWSSTTYMPTLTSAWYVNFNDGPVANNPKSTPNYVRCVATGP